MKQTEKEAIAAKLRVYVESKESQNAAAKSLLGVSAATVSQILNGKWELIADDMWRTVANQIGYDPRRWSVVQTEGYSRMTQVLTDAQRHSLVMAVVGDAGCGKSQAIKTYAEQNRGVIALSCSEYWNRKEFLGELLQNLGVEPGGTTVADMVREAIRQLKRREGVLIVMDEADKLSDQVLHFFITIYNKLEDTVGIVLCATQYLKKRIERGGKQQPQGLQGNLLAHRAQVHTDARCEPGRHQGRMYGQRPRRPPGDRKNHRGFGQRPTARKTSCVRT